MLQVFIKKNNKSELLDLAPGTVLQMERPTDAFDEELETADFSLPITVPWTENNRRILNFAERLQNFSTASNFFECDVYDDGYPEILGGKFYLLSKSGKFSYLQGSFSANITGARGLFGSRLRDKKLSDIDYGDDIIFPTNIDSRTFATNHAKGQYNNLNHLAFAPVVIENFFNQEGAEYNGEFLAKDTVNNIVATGLGTDDWVFGRQHHSSANVAIPAGQEEYVDYRTVPFFSAKWILQKIMAQLGYQLNGDLLSDPMLEDVFLYNNLSIERYNMITFTDSNRRIKPADHMPDIRVVDFLRRFFFFFNVYPTFPSGNKIILKNRNRFLQERSYTNITGRALSVFESTYRDATQEGGYELDYEIDPDESYFSEHVKDIDDKILAATVSTLAELSATTFPFPLSTDHVALVTSENMYYVVTDATSTPASWEVYSENLLPLVAGEAGRKVSLGMGILATYIASVSDAQTRINKVAARQFGSYYTGSGSFVKSPFGLTVFFIKKISAEGKFWPVSFNHNTDPAGNTLTTRSLTLRGANALGELHESWQQMKDKIETYAIDLLTNRALDEEMSTNNMMLHNSVALVPIRKKYQIPAGLTIRVEALAL